VFLLNSQAGGVSITLDAADELHALDEMYPPEANEQLFGRIFRRGRVHEVFYYLYRSMGTIDEEIGYKVADGQQKQARLLDGRRGKEYAREIAKYKGVK
jgi:SNF2 family DNA or RNA helicase